LSGFLAWLTVGGAFYVLHDLSMIMSMYKRGRGRGIVAGTIAGGCVPMFPESGPPFPHSGPLLGWIRGVSERAPPDAG